MSARIDPRRTGLASRLDQIPIAISTRKSAGRSRFARRAQNAMRSSVLVRPHSVSSSEVIRYPDRTKNVSTPRKPPLKPLAPKWNAMTPPTATARSPSSAGLWPKVVGSPASEGARVPVARTSGGILSSNLPGDPVDQAVGGGDHGVGATDEEVARAGDDLDRGRLPGCDDCRHLVR